MRRRVHAEQLFACVASAPSETVVVAVVAPAVELEEQGLEARRPLGVGGSRRRARGRRRW